MVTTLQQFSPNIRPLRSRRDLAAIADLIEVCFADTMDADGRDYLRHIRRMAVNTAGWGEVANPFGRIATGVQGFVWEADHKIVGNLTLIPFFRKGFRIFLVANVAVHPQFRGQGIARELTLYAVDYARTHGATSTWLHVRDDNPVAIGLYSSIGFMERTRRSTWMQDRLTSLPEKKLPEGMHVRPRQRLDWKEQKLWLEVAYPPEVTWNLGLDLDRFKPDFFKEFLEFLGGESVSHISIRQKHQLLGVVSWESTRMYADTIWVAARPGCEESTLRVGLPALRRILGINRPLSVNFPVGIGEQVFLDCNFYLHNTLIWMETKY